MTPAEQGQERFHDPVHVIADMQRVIDELRSELEMCQRYFDPMRRSRDEAEKREKALREALERGLGLWETASTRKRQLEAIAVFRAALDQSGKGARG